MADFFRDPDFPDRPQSQDYWRMVEVINRLDGEATEGGRGSGEVTAEYADPEAVMYMALQRAMRMENATRGAIPAELVAALWIDGFVAGAAFQKAGGHRDEQDATPSQ